MKNLITILFLIPFVVLSQLPYSWIANINPGWTSSNPSNNTLAWQGSITTVSTAGWNAGMGFLRYNNNQTTNYTSPTMNFTSCNTSSYVSVTVNLDINLETNFDFLYFQYSTDNGVTWINLGAYTGALGNITPNYIIPNSTNRFRFVFTSDPSVNSYSIGATTYVYFADILGFNITCPVFLPVDLVSFKGYKQSKSNKLVWYIDSENDCDYYTLERSINGKEWQIINTITAINSDAYVVYDDKFEEVINYYRLSQTDLNGTKLVYEDDLVSIDNRTGKLKVIAVTNLLGQTVNDNYSGIVIWLYEDGSTIKKIQ